MEQETHSLTRRAVGKLWTPMPFKRCHGCGRLKFKAEFYSCRLMRDGLTNLCILCINGGRGRSRRNVTGLNADQRQARKRTLDNYHRTEHRRRYPEREFARSKAAQAIQSGKLLRQPCEVCGSEQNIEAHHDDYSKPLNVRWLCRKHHLAVERKRRAARKAA